MAGSGDTLAGLFGMTEFMVPMVLDDITQEQARERPRGEGGPSIEWTIGHLLNYRIFMLNRFGSHRDNPFEERFGNAPATDGSDYPTMDELREAWSEVGAEFMATLSGLSEEELDAKLEDGPHADKALRDQIVFFAWHEGYHMGAVGQLRKELGLPGPAERVMAMRKAEAEGSPTD